MAKRNRAKGRGGALRFYADVVGLDHLHYGMWADDPADLSGLKAAQQRYTEHLIGLIDADVRTILDCGCGVGTTARALSGKGYAVEGLTPDAYQKENFEARTGLTCHLSPFQDFTPPHPYDLILMSESCAYIPIDRLIPAVLEAAPGGRWLIADYFTRYRDGTELTKSGHLLNDFLARCNAAGLVLEYEEDITDRVVPTLDLVRNFIDDRALPTARMLGRYLADRYPVLYPPAYRLVRFLMRKVRAKAERQRILIDSDAFRAAKRYVIYRFRIPGTAQATPLRDAPPTAANDRALAVNE